VPEVLVRGVLDFLAERGYADVQEVITAEEKLVFSLPRELKNSTSGAGPFGANSVGHRV
jgi:4-hydroxy-3-methylbut-2-en-1-yl diphosphate reductase